MAGNPNWINKGLSSGQQSWDVAARFQADVVSLHPAIVHILVGSLDSAFATDGSDPFVVAGFISNIMSMVEEAKAANIKVILATTPGLGGPPFNFGITQMNAFIESYGAANGIPVINYADALCNCVSSVCGVGNGSTNNTPTMGYAFPLTGSINSPAPLMQSSGTDPGFPDLVPSAAGYALMTPLAETTIATMNLTLKSGWLQNVDLLFGPIPDDTEPPLTNQNSVIPGEILQFTLGGLYSDGVSRALLNSNFAGSNGTWTSSNLEVPSPVVSHCCHFCIQIPDKLRRRFEDKRPGFQCNDFALKDRKIVESRGAPIPDLSAARHLASHGDPLGRVAPLAGAWIETALAQTANNLSDVLAPTRGRGLKRSTLCVRS